MTFGKRSTSVIATGILLLLGTSAVTAQLTQNDNQALRRLAKDELNHALSKTEHKDAQRDLEEIIEAAQALELLGEGPKAEEVCKVIKKITKHHQDKTTVAQVYHLAEAYRMFKCDNLKNINEQLRSLFNNEVGKMTNPSNLHYAYVLNQNAKDYGLTPVENFLADRTKDHLLSALNQTDFSIEGSRQEGLSKESLEALEIFASLQRSPQVGSQTKAIITTFISKITAQSVTNNDKFSFFSKNTNVGSAELNQFVLSIIKLSDGFDNLSKEQKVGLRNFFVQNAVLSHSVKQLLPSLRGLKAVGSVPAVRLAATSKRSLPVTDSSKQVKFDLVDGFGNSLKGSKQVKVSLVDVSDNKAGIKDITSSVSLSNENSVATVSLGNIGIGRYQLNFQVDSFITQSPILTVTDALKISSVQYSVEKSSRFPSKFEGKVENPNKIASIKQASDDFFIHFAVSAGFSTSNDKPAQVFITLERKSTEKSLRVNSQCKLNKDTGLYEGSFDVSKDFEMHFNGDYEITVHSTDYRSQGSVSWKLGTVKIWYKEGLEEGSNNGVKKEYQPLQVIEWISPPAQAQINLLLPLVGVGALGFFFLRFIGSLFANRANLSRLNFSGILFLGNLLLILFIFTAFFIEVKLIPTLWLLLFISPVSFFLAQRALQSADCTIGEFRAAPQSSSEQAPSRQKREKNE